MQIVFKGGVQGVPVKALVQDRHERTVEPPCFTKEGPVTGRVACELALCTPPPMP